MKLATLKRQLNRPYYVSDIVSWGWRKATLGAFSSPKAFKPPNAKLESPPKSPPEGATTESDSTSERPRFLISSLCLRRCYEYLMKNQNESIAYLTGIKIDGDSILDELIPFNMERQEVCYVKGDIVSSTAALMMLSDRGYTLLGTIHCHPGAGAAATHPSGIDKKHHRRLEAGGFEALGIIMTRDGHTRFYTDKLAYDIEVIGYDGYWVSDDIFKLELDFEPSDEESPEGSEVEDKGQEIPIEVQSAEGGQDD